MKFYISDAFTDKIFGGNTAGVVPIPDGQDFPREEVMLKTAAELRYSETAFIRNLGNRRFHVRYFTPAAEVDLCGHATIGSFSVLKEAGIISSGDTCTAVTKAGEIQIYIGGDDILMDMAPPVDMTPDSIDELVPRLMNIMGLERQRPAMTPGFISTGLPDIMLPVKDRKTLGSIDPDFKALAELSDKLNVVGVHAFTVNDDCTDIHARNFAPLYDIDEEAATGTSNGALAYYLYKQGVLPLERKITVIQGEKMGRPSAINAVVTEENEIAENPTAKCAGSSSFDESSSSNNKEVKIKVGGKAVTVAKGEIFI